MSGDPCVENKPLLKQKIEKVGWGKEMASISQSEFQKHIKMSFDVDEETEFRLRKFKQKLEKEKKEPVSFNETLKALLDESEKTKLAINPRKYCIIRKDLR